MAASMDTTRGVYAGMNSETFQPGVGPAPVTRTANRPKPVHLRHPERHQRTLCGINTATHAAHVIPFGEADRRWWHGNADKWERPCQNCAQVLASRRLEN